MTTAKELEDIVSVWKSVKMLSPLLIPLLCGFCSLVLYYLRSMSTSMKHVGESLVRMEVTLSHHDSRLVKLETHCPILNGKQQLHTSAP